MYGVHNARLDRDGGLEDLSGLHELRGRGALDARRIGGTRSSTGPSTWESTSSTRPTPTPTAVREEILGNALAEYDRDEQVVATKVRFPVGEDTPNASGLSRKTIEQELDDSLDRLGLDTIDLYQTHRVDPNTPPETTLRALDDAVRRGKIRHAGTSSMYAHHLAERLRTSEREDLVSYETMQNHYHLAYREEERDMLPLCDRNDIGVVPWGPLGQGS